MSIRQIFCLRFPNRQFGYETMPLVGICWNMMASSVFPYVFVLLRQRSEDIYSGFEVILVYVRRFHIRSKRFPQCLHLQFLLFRPAIMPLTTNNTIITNDSQSITTDLILYSADASK